MDKLKALAQKCNIKPELANRFFEAVKNHLATERAKDLTENKRRQAEAKRVCLEEVESYKRDLARRVQTFCEAKGGQIEQSIARQTAIRESAAQVKLRNILSMLEGVEPNGEHNGALQAENKKLKRRMQQLASESKQAVGQANRQAAIAERVLAKNRALEGQLTESRRNGGQTISETRAVRKPTQRLDEGRQRRPSGEPVTTRATLRESQDRQPRRTTVAPRGDGDYTPEGIAASMETDLI